MSRSINGLQNNNLSIERAMLQAQQSVAVKNVEKSKTITENLIETLSSLDLARIFWDD